VDLDVPPRQGLACTGFVPTGEGDPIAVCGAGLAGIHESQSEALQTPVYVNFAPGKRDLAVDPDRFDRCTIASLVAETPISLVIPNGQLKTNWYFK